MSLPKFFKDESGFCYAASEQLARNPALQSWDGAIDAQGFAADSAQETSTPKRRSRRTENNTVNSEPTVDDLLAEVAGSE